MNRVDLVWIGDAPPPPWSLGRVILSGETPGALHETVSSDPGALSADALLFWASRLGAPDAAQIEEALGRPGDVWHAGLRFGMGGLPGAIDFVAPTWMLNRDPSPAIEATSWRLSLEACLVRTEVLRRLGGVRPDFESLAGAGLELGHRWVTRGALLRYLPSLSSHTATEAVRLPFEDEMRFIYYRFGRFWLGWALLRSVLTRVAGLRSAIGVGRRIGRVPAPPSPDPLRQAMAFTSTPIGKTVTVLIPTVDRYPYLAKLLDQLAQQTVPPLEVIVVDQTPADRRHVDLEASFPSLPLQVIYLGRAGQCSSRNAGIELARGDLLLLLDDDVEIEPDLIENHFRTLAAFRSETSSGVSEEVGAGPLAPAFRLIRTSDVFPAGNSLLNRLSLSGSGLFDLAYDHGARADADLGMRLYLAGNLMILNPHISVLHHHAPSGGLRTHGARVITYASSRKKLAERHLPGATEIYLALRYFSARQVREFLWLQAAATLAFKGGPMRRILKALIGVALLPDTLRRLRLRARDARALLEAGPKIPPLRASVDDERAKGAAAPHAG